MVTAAVTARVATGRVAVTAVGSVAMTGRVASGRVMGGASAKFASFDADQEERATGPSLSDDILADDLDSAVKAELLPLAKPVAETVARHLVATGKLIDEDPAAALEHALAARRLASRIAAVREAVGLAAYYSEEWATAIAELRTYHRMTGGRRTSRSSRTVSGRWAGRKRRSTCSVPRTARSWSRTRRWSC